MKRLVSFIAGDGALVAAMLLSVSVLMLSNASAAETARRAAGVATLSIGEDLYRRQGCYQCHGLVGQGSIQSGPKLSPLRLDSAGFRNYVRDPRGSMPPFTVKILPEADLAQIEAFVRSLPRPRAAATIPLLATFTMHNADAGNSRSNASATSSGSTLYAQNCAACHGLRLEGGIGSDLRGEAAKRDVAGIIQVILAPPPGMPRLYPSPLSRSEVEAVAAFVHTGK